MKKHKVDSAHGNIKYAKMASKENKFQPLPFFSDHNLIAYNCHTLYFNIHGVTARINLIQEIQLQTGN